MIDLKNLLSESKPQDLTVFVLGHDHKQFERIKNRDYLKHVRLDQLQVNEYQRNDFAESRFLFTKFENTIETNYVGLATASWNQKYKIQKDQTRTCMVDFLHRLELKPNRVWAARVTDGDWRAFSIWAHPGIETYLDKIEKITNIDSKGKSLWSNNFLCHKNVMTDFLAFFRKTWDTLNSQYNWDYNFGCRISDANRLSGMLAERVSMYYWRSRTDLDLIQMDQII